MIIYDTETNGLISNIALPLKDQPQIVELFALKLDDSFLEHLANGKLQDITLEGMLVGTWHSLFHVDKLPDDAVRVHGITFADIATAPSFSAKFDSLAEFFSGERYMAGHNISFDRDMLWLELKRLGKQCAFPWPWHHIDTVECTEGDEGYRLGLGDLHERLFGHRFAEAHRAEPDVMATAKCVVELIRQGKVKL